MPAERRSGEDRQAGERAAERRRPASGEGGILEGLLGDRESRRDESRATDLADPCLGASTSRSRLAGDADEKRAGGGVTADLG